MGNVRASVFGRPRRLPSDAAVSYTLISHEPHDLVPTSPSPLRWTHWLHANPVHRLHFVARRRRTHELCFNRAGYSAACSR